MVLAMDIDPAPALEPARSLHEVFQSLAGDPDPDAVLAAAGHAGLPADLLTEAIVSFADTAPPEVAEHLTPVLLGASADAGLGLELLTSAPQVTWEDDVVEAAEEPAWAGEGPSLEELDFGAGGDDLDALDAPDDDVPGEPVDDVPDVEVPEVAEAGDLPDDHLSHPNLEDEGWADAWDGTTGDLSGDLPDELPDDLDRDDNLPDA